MNCEGCEREVGDLRALKAHRKACDEYKKWSTRAASPVPSLSPQHHVYEGRKLPTMYG